MHFENPNIFLIIAFLVLLGLFLLYLKTFYNLLKKFGIAPNYEKHIIILFSLGFLFFALAFLKPYIYTDRGIKEKTNNSEIVFLLDVSTSMLTEDMDKGFSRLEISKEFIKKFISDNPSNKYGLFIFAGDIETISPVTKDTTTINNYINNISPDSISKGGTNIMEALYFTSNRFSENENTNKTLILFSDGEETIGNTDTSKLDDIKNKNIHLITLGVGTKKGGYIPLGTNLFGEKSYKMYDGQPVTSKLEEKSLQDITTKLNGTYKQIGDIEIKEIFDNIVGDINILVVENNKYGKYSLVGIFLVLSLIFILIGKLIHIGTLKKYNAKIKNL